MSNIDPAGTDEVGVNQDALDLTRQVINQARLAISSAGHRTKCQFKGCTCGAAEAFRMESGEFWRLVQKLKEALHES